MMEKAELLKLLEEVAPKCSCGRIATFVDGRDHFCLHHVPYSSGPDPFRLAEPYEPGERVVTVLFRERRVAT